MPRKQKPDILNTAKKVVTLLAKSGLSVGDQFRVVGVVSEVLPKESDKGPL